MKSTETLEKNYNQRENSYLKAVRMIISMVVAPFGWDEAQQQCAGIIANMPKARDETLDLAANLFVQEVKLRAPKNTGKYASSISVVASGDGWRMVSSPIQVMSLKSGKTWWLWRLLEHGTNPHDIEPIIASTLFFIGKKGPTFTKLVHHPGHPEPIPHFEPASDEVRRHFPNIWIESAKL